MSPNLALTATVVAVSRWREMDRSGAIRPWQGYVSSPEPVSCTAADPYRNAPEVDPGGRDIGPPTLTYGDLRRTRSGGIVLKTIHHPSGPFSIQ